MVLKVLNNYLSGNSKKFPREFNKIINEINFDPQKESEQIELLWNAYNVGINAHKNQLRKSGKPYFSHCIEVAVILSKWKMDIDTISTMGGVTPEQIQIIMETMYIILIQKLSLFIIILVLINK